MRISDWSSDVFSSDLIDDELMVELEQIKAETKPIEVLFVADAMTGQDAVRSAEVFLERVGLTGVVLTKMDGDARGGAALSIKQEIGRASCRERVCQSVYVSVVAQ